MSQKLQYIIVLIILAAVVGWIIYGLVRKKPRGSACSCCSLSKSCKKKIQDSDCDNHKKVADDYQD